MSGHSFLLSDAISEEQTGLSPDTESNSTLILDFQPPELMRKKLLFFVSNQVSGIFLQHKQTKTFESKSEEFERPFKPDIHA